MARINDWPTRLPRAATAAAQLAFFFVIAGCTHTMHAPVAPPGLQPPAIEALPVAVGVHYPDEFRNAYRFQPRLSPMVAPLYANKTWEYPYGQASVDVLNASFRSMFERVAPIRAWPPESGSVSALSGFIVARAVQLDVQSMTWRRPHDSYVKIGYRIELLDASGKPLTSWAVESALKEGPNALLSDAINAAIYDAAAQFLRRFLQEREQVGRWLTNSPAGKTLQ